MEKLSVDIKKVIDLRQKLHKFPELSGKEQQTLEIIKNFFKPLKYNTIHQIGTSIAFEFGEENAERTIVFRADIDALPINERLGLPYASVHQGVSHKCGHDGHTAILAGLAQIFSKKKPKDKVILLFQSAEETLSGAVNILSDSWFKTLDPDVIVGFHNIPGYERNTIIVKKEEFNAYVVGMRISIRGETAHAAYARGNVNFIKILREIFSLIETEFYENEFSKIADLNLTYANYGVPSFGISPDFAVIHIVLRAFSNEDLEKAMEWVENKIKSFALPLDLSVDITYTEDAPAIYNSPQLAELILKTAKEERYQVVYLKEPFPWGEDFGFYTIRYRGIYFGIGAGTDTPQLHSPNYDFPDEIILPSIEFLYKFYLKLS